MPLIFPLGSLADNSHRYKAGSSGGGEDTAVHKARGRLSFSDLGVTRVNSGKQSAPLHPLISLKTTPRPPKPGGFRVPPSAEENVNRCFLPCVAWLLTSISVPHRLDCVQEAQVFWVSPCQGLWTPFDLPDHQQLLSQHTPRLHCSTGVCGGAGIPHDFFFSVLRQGLTM